MRSKLAPGLLAVLLLGGLVKSRTEPGAAVAGSDEVREGRAQAQSLYLDGRYREAELAYERSYRLAEELGDREEAVRCLNGLGGARFAMLQYREALRAYLEARRLARSLGRAEFIAAIQANLSSLYLQQQDVNAGARLAEEALQALRSAGPTKFGPLLRTQSAIMHARQGDLEGAIGLFREALSEAYLAGEPATLGLIWDQLGYELLARGRLEEAEAALVEAFRIRKLHRLKDLQYSYYTLGLLYLAAGRPAEARRMLDEALWRLSGEPATLALWRVYYERGRAASEMGDAPGALADFRRAVDHARRIRMELLPADSVWINTGVDQHQLYSALVRTSGTLHAATGLPAYARLAFEAAEENRAAGLRALILSPGEWRSRLPAGYWEALARLRGMESRLLKAEDAGLRAELGRLHSRLTEMEAEAGLDLFPRAGPGRMEQAGLLQRIQPALHTGETFFSLHQDEPESYLWVVTPSEFHAFRLAGRRRLSALAARFQAAVRGELPERIELGRQLYAALFSSVPERLLASPRWSLSLDGDLCQAPLAALVSSPAGAPPVYLAERRAIRSVPSAELLGAGSRRVWDATFVGVGDAVYNLADRRHRAGRRDLLPRAAEYLAILPRLGMTVGRVAGPELPRLAGSGGEIRACADAWCAGSRQPVLLTGPQASLPMLERALAPGVSAVHFATHFVPSSCGARRAMIALSLNQQGVPELLGPAEISRRRLDVGLVALSGCASAAAETAHAEGLMGLTRAWLAAGARAVMATLWPMADDEGRLLVSFYRHMAALRFRGDGWFVPEALQRAQLEALRSGAPYGSPSYWGAYILAVRE